MSRGRAWLEVHMAALAASRSTAEAGTAGWDPQILSTSAPQHLSTSAPQHLSTLQGLKQVLQACKALSNVYLQHGARIATRLRQPVVRFSLSFSLSGSPAGRNVSRLSGGVIGGRCIGLNEKG
jgi:hypothetical protein